MKLYLSMALLALSISASAQKRLYLKPSISTGISQVNNMDRFNAKDKFISVYGIGADLGYQLSRLRLQTGLRIMQTGEATDINIPYVPFRHTPGFSIERRTRLTHVVIPVLVAYQVKLPGRFSLVPSVGGMISYNLAETTKSTNSQEPGVKYRDTELFGFDRSFAPVTFTFFATAELGVVYQLTKNIKLHATPAYNQMITDMAHTTTIGPLDISVKPYNIMLNLGIVKEL